MELNADTSFYAAALVLSAGETEASEAGVPGLVDRAMPFDPGFRIAFDGDSAPGEHEEFFRERYGWREREGYGPAWRRVGADWLRAAEELALQLDNHVNNTSLALAISLGPVGDVVLLPADAQAGNWLSWHDLAWDDVDCETVTGRDLLERAAFYKVGHHGRHNATLRALGLELMDSPELVAMIPVDGAQADEKEWKMPFEPHVAMPVQNPVIVLHGITGSSLRDTYPVDPERVWSVFSKDYDRIALHPDDIRYERDEPARVVAHHSFEIVYGEIVKELRHDLTSRADEPTPVFPFTYDWRQPLEPVEARLEAFVREVVDRCGLLRHYYRAGWTDDPRVDLIGHSMGGLIIAGYLERRGEEALVGKVATLGSPFRGSFEAVLKITTGLAALGESTSASREREVARVTPALYHLLPSFDGAVDGTAELPDSLYDPDLWQPSVLETIAEYIRLYGREGRMSKEARLERAGELFQRMLDGARRHRERLESFEPEGAGLTVDDWLCIVGVGEVTRVTLKVEAVRGEPAFQLRSVDRRDGYPHGAEGGEEIGVIEPWETGDGTVPYRGARSAFIPVQKLVCLTDDDLGYWEIRDRALEALGPGLHGTFPKMNVVHRLITAHFKAGPGERAKGSRSIWGRPPPRLPEDPDSDDAPWDPPIEGLRDRS